MKRSTCQRMRGWAALAALPMMLTVPAYAEPGVTPVKAWQQGYSAEQADALRGSYKLPHFMRGDDVGAYTFSHLSELFNVAQIRRGGPVRMLEFNPVVGLDQVVSHSPLGELSLRQLLEHDDARMQAYAVVHKGKLVFEAYPGMREQDSHVWMSATKTVTGLLAYQLAAEGKLDLSRKVSQYLAEFAGTDWDKVSVLDVLNMASGMDFVESPASLRVPDSPVSRAFRAALMGPTDGSRNESLSAILKEVKLVREPGTAFDYSTFNTQVVGLILERVSGHSFADLFSERIWSKAGMEGDGQMALSPNGEILNGGIFASRLRDFARYGMLYTPSWKLVSDTPVVTEGYFDAVYQADMVKDYNGGIMGPRMENQFGEPPSHAAYQWDAIFADGDLYKSGRNGQGLYVSPATDTVVVWFASGLNNEFWVPNFARAIVKRLNP